jgi:hypothetical protein
MNLIFLIFCFFTLFSFLTSCRLTNASPIKPMKQFETWAVGDRFQPAYDNNPPHTMVWKGKQQDLIIKYDWFLL